jgi:hypothetical protein
MAAETPAVPPHPLPDGLPVLSRGRHRSPDRGACFLEYTALLAGEPFSDEPACVDRHLAGVLRQANDLLRDADRGRLVPLLGRAVGLVVPPPGAPPAEDAWHPAVVRYAALTTGLHRTVSARFTAALGVQPTAAEEEAWDGGRDVGHLFWALMDRPVPAVTSAAWVDRLVARLDLLHTCYEQALAGLRPAQSAGPVASVTVAECSAPSLPVQVTVTR